MRFAHLVVTRDQEAAEMLKVLKAMFIAALLGLQCILLAKPNCKISPGLRR